MQSLSRPLARAGPWGPIKSFILGGISFGIWPLIAWPKRFGHFVVAEQQQYWHLVEWLRLRTGDAEAASLRDSVKQTGAPLTVWLVPLVLIGVIVARFLPYLPSSTRLLHSLVLATYDFGRHGNPHAPSATQMLFETWTICLSAAYLSHWIHVRSHARRVGKMVRQINALLVRENVPPVTPVATGLGFRPLWIIAACIGCYCGAWWAIPAAIAGASHARYVSRTSLGTRGQLAQRVRMLLVSQRPALNVATPFRLRLQCSNRLCRSLLPEGATFCSRCGSRAPQKFEKIA